MGTGYYTPLSASSQAPLEPVLRPGAAHGYCVGLMTPASLAGEAAYS
jgi:hypothetical protein